MCWVLLAHETQVKILTDDVFGVLLYWLLIIDYWVDTCPGEAARDHFKAEAPPPSLRHVIRTFQTKMAAPGGVLLFFAVFAVIVAVFYGAGPTASWSTAVLLGLIGMATLSLWRLRQRNGGTNRRVCVLVLGDIGRSPRMRYHSLSLSKHGFSVTFVGFVGKSVHKWSYIYLYPDRHKAP